MEPDLLQVTTNVSLQTWPRRADAVCWAGSDLQQAGLWGAPRLHVPVAKREMRRGRVCVQVGHLEVLGLDRLRPAAVEEGVLSPVGGADGGLRHVVDDERQRRKLRNKVQLKQRHP